MTAKMGFQKRPWENDVMLANRVMRAKNRALDDELIRVSNFVDISINLVQILGQNRDGRT